MKRPIGVTLISYFYLFGAAVLFISAIFNDAGANTIGIAERFGLPYVPERMMRVLVALLSFVLVYGYIRLTNWGYWFMIVYSILFGYMSALLISSPSPQPFLGNVIFSIVVLIYTIYVRKSFLQSSKQRT
ncbi:hypothetical protein GLW07_00410 [Bacillus hwajinpoensis]|uniref:DUF2127 domain-containing protein n=1 Tax=Guptibacillus hwajinpoensis TaxID=208199 RepID=A0A845EVM3_9BACL|nr:hypothetical protein [Pseudalkalibacillus hwajinpoensis]MYL61805.1 hypothetical protein [Pseudalkalibacillus hwajinpoensis]